MPAVLQALMADLILPHMNAYTVHGNYLEHNTPSRKVFEKCGFVFEDLVPEAVALNPTKLNGVQKKLGTGRTVWQRKSSG